RFVSGGMSSTAAADRACDVIGAPAAGVPAGSDSRVTADQRRHVPRCRTSYRADDAASFACGALSRTAARRLGRGLQLWPACLLLSIAPSPPAGRDRTGEREASPIMLHVRLCLRRTTFVMNRSDVWAAS